MYLIESWANSDKFVEIVQLYSYARLYFCFCGFKYFEEWKLLYFLILPVWCFCFSSEWMPFAK